MKQSYLSILTKKFAIYTFVVFGITVKIADLLSAISRAKTKVLFAPFAVLNKQMAVLSPTLSIALLSK